MLRYQNFRSTRQIAPTSRQQRTNLVLVEKATAVGIIPLQAKCWPRLLSLPYQSAVCLFKEHYIC